MMSTYVQPSWGRAGPVPNRSSPRSVHHLRFIVRASASTQPADASDPRTFVRPQPKPSRPALQGLSRTAQTNSVPEQSTGRQHLGAAQQQGLPNSQSRTDHKDKPIIYPAAQPQQVRIQDEYRSASRAIKTGDAAKIMKRYFSRIDGHFAASERRLSYQHISAALYGTAHVWTAAQSRHGPRLLDQLRPELGAFLTKMLARVQRVLPKMDCRGVSSECWSFAKLGINPYSLLPGITNRLAERYIEDIGASNGQDHANMLLACAELRLDPCHGSLFEAILLRLRQTELAKCNSQDLANILHNVAKLPTAQPSSQFLMSYSPAFVHWSSAPDMTSAPLPKHLQMWHGLWPN